MDLIEIQEPVWYLLAIAATWLYLPVALIFLRRVRDARLIVALPLVADTAVGAYGGASLLNALTFVPDLIGPVVRASSVLESFVPSFYGAAIGVVLALVAQFSIGPLNPRRRSRSGSIVLMMATIFFAAWVAVMFVSIHVSASAAGSLKYLALFLCVGGALLAAAMLLLGVFGDAGQDGQSSRWLFLAFAAVLALVALALRTAQYRLHEFIMRGGA